MKRITLSLLLLFPTLSFAGTLTNLLNDAKEAYGWTCTGSTCYAIVNEEIRALNAIVAHVDALPEDNIVSANDGKIAKRVATLVCGQTMTIEYDYLIPLVNAENRALARLKALQESAGVAPRTCTKRIN